MTRYKQVMRQIRAAQMLKNCPSVDEGTAAEGLTHQVSIESIDAATLQVVPISEPPEDKATQNEP